MTSFQNERMTAAITRGLVVAAALVACASPNAGGVGQSPLQAGRPVADSSESARRQSTTGITTIIPTEADARLLRFEDLLASRVPGLQVARKGDGTFSLRIRGQSGLRGGVGDAEPLLVIDGVMIPQGSLGPALSSLAPRDIARIDVLKDIAATGPYGSRGANGVVIVFTKRSKASAKL